MFFVSVVAFPKIHPIPTLVLNNMAPPWRPNVLISCILLVSFLGVRCPVVLASDDVGGKSHYLIGTGIYDVYVKQLTKTASCQIGHLFIVLASSPLSGQLLGRFDVRGWHTES
jgi:hypothetical protein